MTVIATLISAHCTAHATDSFVTERADAGRRVVEEQASKLVRVDAWRGAIAYWGLARHGSEWSTIDWLRDQAEKASKYQSAEHFAIGIAQLLSKELASRHFAEPVDAGLGLHFTAYERVKDYWVPELFLISNWTDASYSSVRPRGFCVTRETYPTLKGLHERSPDHGHDSSRLTVQRALQGDGVIFRFNNGDPVLFNPIANSIVDTFLELIRRNQLADASAPRTHLALVRRPVEVVSKLLSDLAKPEMRLVGGKPHDLAIEPNGTFTSTSGD